MPRHIGCCVDTGTTARGCQGISSKQWELGSSGVDTIQSFDKLQMCSTAGRYYFQHWK
jgi:hypothetical protein